VEHRKLGQWGVKVSAVSLGSWLTYGGSVGEDTARACIARAYDLGVTFFDTANSYGRGRAEKVVGPALAAYPRDSYVLATKVYFPMGEGPNDGGLSRKHVTEQCHHSLRRLGVDYIDLYQCHRYDEDTPLEETCRVMDDLVRAGKILYWGVSEWTAEQIRAAVDLCRSAGWAPPASNQPQYSALWRRIEADVLPTSAELGLGTVVWSPLAMGVLTGKYRSTDDLPADSRAAGEDGKFMGRYLTAEVLDAVARLRAVAEEAGVSLAQLSLAWCLRRPEVSSVIVGATKVEHVEDNVAAAGLDPGADALQAVDELLAPHAAA
jgi:aryl-alcohol dehydrogenase-like predicted oxidoreductase